MDRPTELARAVAAYERGDRVIDILNTYAIPKGVLYSAIDAIGIPRRTDIRRLDITPQDRKDITEAYVDGTLSTRDIAEIYGLEVHHVRKIAVRSGAELPYRPKGPRRHPIRADPETQANVLMMYRDGFSAREIGEIVECSGRTVLVALREMGEPIRDRIEARRLRTRRVLPPIDETEEDQ